LGFTGQLSLMMYQRSCDMFLGVPYNISSEALLLSLVAQFTRLQPYELKIILADAHVYHNHFDQVRLQLEREPYPLPRLRIDPSLKSLDGLVDRYRWILRQVDKGAKPGEYLDRVARLDGYRYHPAIKAPLAV
jgi:thymidylate synthase